MCIRDSNMLHEPAMTTEECAEAMLIGAQCVAQEAEDVYKRQLANRANSHPSIYSSRRNPRIPPEGFLICHGGKKKYFGRDVYKRQDTYYK